MPATTANHAALVPARRAEEIIGNVYEESVMLSLCDVQPMSALVEEDLYLDPEAITWPAGMENVAELGTKPEVGDIATSSRQIVAREIAATKVLSRRVATYSVVDLVAAYQDWIEQRFRFLIDYHALNGGGWAGSEGLLPAVSAAGHQITKPATSPDMKALTSQMLAEVEENGFTPDGFIFDIREKAEFRNLEDQSGRPIFYESMTAGSPSTLWGVPTSFQRSNLFGTAAGNLRGIVGDFSQYRIGILEQVSAQVFDSGIVNGVNLIEQNAIALRVEMMIGARVQDADAFATLVQGT